MKSLFVRLALALCPIFAAAAPAQPIDSVWFNGKVWTGDAARPEVTALAVRDDRIVATGRDTEILALADPQTRRVDLAGRRVVPGFNDAHAHYGSRPSSSFFGLGSVEAIQAKLREIGKSLPAGEWLVDGGWAYADFPDRTPHRRFLDAVFADRPVAITGRDGHMVLVNTRALELLGITRDTPEPDQGRILRDARGELTGELTGTAQNLVMQRLPAPGIDVVAGYLRRDFALAARNGVTSAQQMHEMNGTAYAALLQLLGEGGVTTRLTIAQALPETIAAADAAIARAKALKAIWRGPIVKYGVVKGILDGTIDAHTAGMLQPLTDGTNGFNYYPRDVLNELVLRYDRAGLQIALHATGDRTIREALDAYEQAAKTNGTSGMRHRIEHADLATPGDVERFRALGVIPSSQPNFAYPDANNLQNYERLLGKRMARAQAYRTLDRYALAQPFGNDFPVSPMDVLRAMHTAVARTDRDGKPVGGWYPGERISVTAALRHFTLDGAIASHDEADKGTLSPGKLADFVILSQDILDDPETSLLKADVEMTVMGGAITYRHSR